MPINIVSFTAINFDSLGDLKQLNQLIFLPNEASVFLSPKLSDSIASVDSRHAYHSTGIDLTTGIRVKIDEDTDRHHISDCNIGEALNAFGALCVIAPYKEKPVENPLHGNLHNPDWASINTGGKCNHKCSFCYTEWIRNIPEFTNDEIRKSIFKISQIKSIRMIAFTGGEPTLREDLLDLIKYAREQGIRKISVQTNGCRLSSKLYAKRFLAAGVDSVLISLHGATRETHDGITRVKGSFDEVLLALNNIEVYSHNLIVNFVVNNNNYKELPMLARLLNRIVPEGCRLRISYPIAEGAAYDNKENVLVSFRKITPLLKEAIDICKTKRTEIETATMPLCVGSYPEIPSAYTVKQLRSFVEVSPFYAHNIHRGELSVKLGICSECLFSNLCRGIQIAYLKAFPNDYECFSPINKY